MSSGLRAYQGVNAHVQGFAYERHTTTDSKSAKVQTHSAETALYRRFSPNGSTLWRPHHLKPRPHRHQPGEITPSKPPTRRRHADDTPQEGFAWRKTPIAASLKCTATPTTLRRSTGWRDNIATLKPTTPLLAPNTGPLKPASPLHPKTAPNTPISRPQRRQGFQLRFGRRPQRRWRFQPHTGTSERRRQGFQTTGPPGRQNVTTAPVGGGLARQRYPWALSVTNVVKPEEYEAPSEDSCYKRRQSAPKNHYFQRKSRRIDDVCNNGSKIHTKNTVD